MKNALKVTFKEDFEKKEATFNLFEDGASGGYNKCFGTSDASQRTVWMELVFDGDPRFGFFMTAKCSYAYVGIITDCSDKVECRTNTDRDIEGFSDAAKCKTYVVAETDQLLGNLVCNIKVNPNNVGSYSDRGEAKKIEFTATSLSQISKTVSFSLKQSGGYGLDDCFEDDGKKRAVWMEVVYETESTEVDLSSKFDLQLNCKTSKDYSGFNVDIGIMGCSDGYDAKCPVSGKSVKSFEAVTAKALSASCRTFVVARTDLLDDDCGDSETLECTMKATPIKNADETTALTALSPPEGFTAVAAATAEVSAASDPSPSSTPSDAPTDVPVNTATDNPTDIPVHTPTPTDASEAPTDLTEAPTDAPVDTAAPTDPTESPTDPSDSPTDIVVDTVAPTETTEAPTDPAGAPSLPPTQE